MDKVRLQALIEKKVDGVKSLYCQEGAVKFIDRVKPILKDCWINQDIVGGNEEPPIRKIRVFC